MPVKSSKSPEQMSAWGWLSRGGALGKKANLAYRASDVSTQNTVVPILNVEGNDADAQQVVITLGQNITGERDNLQMQSRTSFPGTTGVPVVWPPISAVIEWGIGGTSNTAVVDFVDGANVTVLASFVRVKAAIESLADTGVTGTSAIYTLYAQVGPGFSRCHAQRTIFVGSVASLAESGLHAVPKFAKSAYLIGYDPTARSAVEVTVATLRFWQSPDGAAGGRNVGNFPAPVPNAAMYASVVSGMAAPTRFLVVYELAI
jgi:hypothetical protein